MKKTKQKKKHETGELFKLEKEMKQKKRSFYVKVTLEQKRRKHKAEEKLIDELMFSDSGASSIIICHAQSPAEGIKQQSQVNTISKTNRNQFSSGIKIGHRTALKFSPILEQEGLLFSDCTASV